MVKSSSEKVYFKKGTWTPEEDQKLSAYILENGHGSWKTLPAKAGLERCGKSCRLRWINYLRPDIKRGKFSSQEEQTIIQLHALLGNRWSVMATYLPKRTDNEIKNHWNSHLKKRLHKMGIDPVTHKPKTDAFGYGGGGGIGSNSKNTAHLRHIAQWESTRLQAEARLVRESKQLESNNSPTKPKPKCLDVLKAWQEIVSGMFSMPGYTLESPTSILPAPIRLHEKSSTRVVEVASSSGGNNDNNSWGGSIMAKERLDGAIELHEMTSDNSNNDGWFMNSSNNINKAEKNNVMEGFSDGLAMANYDFGEDDENLLMVRSERNINDGWILEDNKKYWNDLFDQLVDTSPSSLREINY